MSRPPTQKVMPQEIESLYKEHNIWERIEESELTSEPVVEKDAPARIAPGGLSRILKHADLDGRHIATTHIILDANGLTVHHDSKDILVDGIRYTRP